MEAIHTTATLIAIGALVYHWYVERKKKPELFALGLLFFTNCLCAITTADSTKWLWGTAAVLWLGNIYLHCRKIGLQDEITRIEKENAELREKLRKELDL